MNKMFYRIKELTNKFFNVSKSYMIEDIIQDIEKSCLEFKVGGPFGAVIYKDGKIVGKGVNRVIGNNDPTAHAEIEAIRNACKNLKTFDLSGCEMYASGYPCPMCMSAIIWSNIKKVYYSANYKDAEKIGFRDDFIYKFLKNGCKNSEILQLEEISKEKLVRLYSEYNKSDKTMY